MRRGIIRLVLGILLIILTVPALIGSMSTGYFVNATLIDYIGYFSPTFVGVILWRRGARALDNGDRSELVLHTKGKAIHVVIKWIGFSLSVLLLFAHLNFFITAITDFWAEFDIFAFLSVFGMFAFSVYFLFYINRKPCCLFSTALILWGMAYIFGLFNDVFFVGLPDVEYFVITGVLPQLFAGVLYIVTACILFKEDFSVSVIKVLGWIICLLEFFNRVVARIIVTQSVYFIDLIGLAELLFVVVLILYLSVFKINTLRGVPTAAVKNTKKLEQREDPPVNTMPVPNLGWRCVCGRPHPRYESSCVCGKSKFDNMNQPKAEETEVVKEKQS